MTENPFGNLPKPGMLQGMRVIETADELGEYCGLLLAGLGAEVIKIEPADGSPTRRIGPYYEDVEGPERSLFFWAYNRGKKSVQVATTEEYLRLVGSADILPGSIGSCFARRLGRDATTFNARLPDLVAARRSAIAGHGRAGRHRIWFIWRWAVA